MLYSQERLTYHAKGLPAEPLTTEPHNSPCSRAICKCSTRLRGLDSLAKAPEPVANTRVFGMAQSISLISSRLNALHSLVPLRPGVETGDRRDQSSSSWVAFWYQASPGA